MPGTPTFNTPGFFLAASTMSAHGLEWRVRRHHQHLIVLEGLADRIERFVGIADLLVGQRLDRDRERCAVHQRVAVGLGVRDRGRADHAAGARLVDDDERLAELRRQAVGEHATQNIRARSRGGRKDDLDDVVRIILCGGAACDAHHRSRNSREHCPVSHGFLRVRGSGPRLSLNDRPCDPRIKRAGTPQGRSAGGCNAEPMPI